MSDIHPAMIYKVAAATDFEQAETDGLYAGAPVDIEDGFIHFSTAEQLPETLRRHFRGRSDLVLAAVETGKLGSELVWEPSRGGDLFPHLYGNLPLSAIAWQEPIEVDELGNCNLPARLG